MVTMTDFWTPYKLGNCNGDDKEEPAKATIDAAKSKQDFQYDWRFHQDYCVEFAQWPLSGSSNDCAIR